MISRSGNHLSLAHTRLDFQPTTSELDGHNRAEQKRGGVGDGVVPKVGIIDVWSTLKGSVQAKSCVPGNYKTGVRIT